MPRRLLPFAIALLAVLLPAGAQAAPGGLVINEIDYDQPGTDGAEFVELRNSGAAAADLTGYRLRLVNGATNAQYGLFDLSGTLAAGDYYVLCGNAATVAGCDQDVTPDTNLIQNGDPDGIQLLDGGGAVVDSVSYEGAMPGVTEGAAGAPGDTADAGSSIGRIPDGCDTDDNATDFARGAATPGASNGPTACSGAGGDAAPAVASTDPGQGDVVPAGATLAVTFTEPVNMDSGAIALTCTGGAPVGIAVTSEDRTTFMIEPQDDLPRGEQCTLAVDGDAVRDADSDDPPDDGADSSVTFAVAQEAGLRIHDIQGARHRSPYADRTVEAVPGVVTAVGSNGFWMQDAQPDDSASTSEGIFVFRGGRPEVGAAVAVTGRVEEFRPGGDADNLTTTEISSPTVTRTGDSAIEPTLIGADGRRPPQRVIEDDALGDVEIGDVLFDPEEDGLDFHESLEGMLVQIESPEAVGPTNGFGEIPVVADGAASVRSPRGGVVVRPDDFNPERMILDDVLVPGEPKVNVGDGFAGPVTAVVDYSFGNFKYLATRPLERVDNGLRREVTEAPTGRQVAIASMNVENLAATDPDAKFSELAGILVDNLRSPDIVALQEVQDDDGAASEGDATATRTWNRFIAAVVAAGGPRYEYRQIDPVPGADGGQPGGNIRVGFLFRPDRKVAFVDRPGGTATTGTLEDANRRGAQLTFSPGRVDPANRAFENSRKPLAGEFRVRGRQLFVIANHFNSKGGDQPLLGRTQPPVRGSEVQRHQQATVVRDFVRSLLQADFTAPVVVLGDFNDFEFSETLRILESGGVGNLMRLLPQSQRYSYVFDGNSQVLDQILVSAGALGWIPEYDSVHVNAEFADQASDHDPQVARLTLP